MNKDKSPANTLLLVLAGISLCLLLFRATGKVVFLRESLAYLLNPMPYYGSRSFERFTNMPADVAQLIYGDIELREARRELKETAYLRAELAAVRGENSRYRSELGIKPSSGRAIRWARVMQRDPREWRRSLMVDAGVEDGIPLNAPVLGLQGGELGVVGRVIEVGRHGSKVLLLTDELSAVAAHLPERGWEGLVQGQGSSDVRMDYLPVEAKLQIGEPVYTSPTSAAYPAGLRIGAIAKIFHADPFLAFQAAEVEVLVTAATLKEVLILVPKTEEDALEEARPDKSGES